ncbi:MAG: site-specific integrase [Planctomycetales bacterium]|nr:site-specific integrase [Planctomycetales bacterium]
MPWLELAPSGVYHVAFRLRGRKFKKSLRTKDPRRAHARMLRIDETIRLVESGRLEIPERADVGAFLFSDGKLTGMESVTTPSVEPPELTLDALTQRFLDSIPANSLEQSTITGMRIHIRHLTRILGPELPIRDLRLGELQGYIDQRAQEKGIKGKRVSAATIKKELTTLRTTWNWARGTDLVTGTLPLRTLRYPKLIAKPPFLTLADIERRIANGQLSDDQRAVLWESLFLTAEEIDELLNYVQSSAYHPVLYPMFAFAAHTGARRSEILRSTLDDIDFSLGVVTIHEKKRVRGQITTRSVPLSPRLRESLRDWISLHPGGPFTFTLGTQVSRSKKERDEPSVMTRDEAHDHFKRILAGTKWAHARGWHVFRHSFCSNCAAAGVDQRMINAWVGHQTEEMVRRYRHLIPNQQQAAIRQVFG